MNKKPIDIQISNEKIFQEVAFLVDRDDFLEDASVARAKFGLSELLSFSYFKKIGDIKINYAYAVRDRLEALVKRNSIVTTKMLKAATKVISKKNLQIMHEYDRRFVNKDYISYTYNLTKKYVGYDAKRFRSIVSDAIIYGFIPDEGLLPSWHLEFERFESIIKDEYYVPFLKIAISDRVKKADFLDMYKKIKDLLPKFNDTISNIKRDRNWYWLHKSGMSYAQIHKQYKQKISKQAVIEAIKQYRKKLLIKL